MKHKKAEPERALSRKGAAPFPFDRKPHSKLYKMNMQNLCILTKFVTGFVETAKRQSKKMCKKNRKRREKEHY